MASKMVCLDCGWEGQRSHLSRLCPQCTTNTLVNKFGRAHQIVVDLKALLKQCEDKLSASQTAKE